MHKLHLLSCVNDRVCRPCILQCWSYRLLLWSSARFQKLLVCQFSLRWRVLWAELDGPRFIEWLWGPCWIVLGSFVFVVVVSQQWNWRCQMEVTIWIFNKFCWFAKNWFLSHFGLVFRLESITLVVLSAFFVHPLHFLRRGFSISADFRRFQSSGETLWNVEQLAMAARLHLK